MTVTQFKYDIDVLVHIAYNTDPRMNIPVIHAVRKFKSKKFFFR